MTHFLFSNFRHLVFALALLVSISLFGQTTLTTKLGQTLIIGNNGSYTIQKQNTASPVDISNPFEKPKAINELDASERLRLQSLENLFLERDAQLTNLDYKSNAELSLKQSALQFAQDQKNAILIPRLVAEVDSLKNLNTLTNKQYAALIKDYENLASLKEENDEKEIIKGIDLLYNKFFSPSPQAQSLDNQKTKIVKQTLEIDKRAPWEINEVIDTSDNSLLTFTPERLKNYYKGRFLLEVFAHIVDDKHIALDFVFASKDIKKGYGIIKKGDFLRIDFIKGQSISLKAIKDVEPTLETYTGNTIYNAIYKLKNKDDYKKLTSSLLDTIGVMWSSGFETYPVYNIDFFKKKRDGNKTKVAGK